MTELPKTEEEAVALQLELRGRLRLDVPLPREPRLVAGVDVAYAVGSDDIAAAVVVLALDDLEVVEVSTVVGRSEFPYVAGLLAFREVPILSEALSRLESRPDVLVCDGYGIAHPRRFGLASHLGLVSGLPSFGVGKTAFTATHGEVGPERGDWAELVEQGEAVGRALRTQRGVKPVYVSVGHLIDLETATELTLRLTPKFRLPETTRRADRACRDALEGQATAPRIQLPGASGSSPV